MRDLQIGHTILTELDQDISPYNINKSVDIL